MSENIEKAPKASKAPKAPKAEKALKAPTKKVEKKEKAPRRDTGNLSFDDAVKAVLKELLRGRKTRTELKAKAPYGNYTSLCSSMEDAGLIKKEDKKEGDVNTYYVITAKGKNQATKAK